MMMWWPAYGKTQVKKVTPLHSKFCLLSSRHFSMRCLWAFVKLPRKLLDLSLQTDVYWYISIWAYTVSDTECQLEMFMFTACNLSSIVQPCFVTVAKKQKRSKKIKERQVLDGLHPVERILDERLVSALFFISSHCLLCLAFSHCGSLVLGV